ncbi:MAG: hypothetical protein ACRYGF_17885 [Janthinobacterium lividum]
MFVLPFLVPPAYLEGQSAANVAGFNNKLAAVAAAFFGCVALVLQVRSGRWQKSLETDKRALSTEVVLVSALVPAAVLTLLSVIVFYSKYLFTADAFYFIDQASKHSEYGRSLYTQIEFPYGPILFYLPIFVRTILTPFHLSIAGAYFVTLVGTSGLGVLMMAYILNALPLSHRIRTVFLILCACWSIPISMGINYTFFRFATPCFFLVLLSKQFKLSTMFAWTLIAQVFCLAMSPEMGLSFASGSFALVVYRAFRQERKWAFTLLAPLIGIPLFLVAVGPGYLRMVMMFARGTNNLVVGPVPHVLLVLAALLWLAPALLGTYFHERRQQTDLLLSFYFAAIALLPAAFGRCDPQHTLFNGLGFLLIALAAISAWQGSGRKILLGIFMLVFTWSILRTATYPFCVSEMQGALGGFSRLPLVKRQIVRLSRHVFRNAIETHYAKRPPEFVDFNAIQQITAGQPIVDPLWLTLRTEAHLKQTGQWVPSFYDYQIAVLDSSAEVHAIDYIESANWMLLPLCHVIWQTERPEETKWMMGFPWTYRSVRKPYVAGRKINAEFAKNWVFIRNVGDVDLFRKRHPDEAIPVFDEGNCAAPEGALEDAAKVTRIVPRS